MITNFKLFEKLDIDEPKRNDYVICTNKYWTEKQNNFFLREIGTIVSISYVNGKPIYRVEYENECTDLPDRQPIKPGWGLNSMTFWRNEIIHWSDNKEELKQFTDLYNDVFKYNL